MNKKDFERSRVAALDLIPIEGENNMLENGLLSRYYAILDIICFAYLNTKPSQKLTALGAIQ